MQSDSNWDSGILCGYIVFNGKVNDKKTLLTELSALSFLKEVMGERDSITAIIVESTDKFRKPYLFIRFAFRNCEMRTEYSLPAEVPNPELRKLEAMRTSFTLLSLLEQKKAFIPDRKAMYEKIVGALELGSAFASTDTLRMKYEYDLQKAENSDLKRELSALKLDKNSSNSKLLELGVKCKRLEERVKFLESATDNELDRKILSWVIEHGGKLNEGLFCTAFGIGGARLEERLDSLSKRRVIRFA